MNVNGKQTGFLYCVGADCDIDDLMQKHGVNDFGSLLAAMGAGKGYAALGEILSKWYHKQHGGEPATAEDFMFLPAGDLSSLQEAVIQAMNDGERTEIKAKQKKAKAAAKSK